MELLVAFVTGAVLAALALRWQSNRSGRKPATGGAPLHPTAESPAESAAEKNPASATARLNALIKELDDIGHDSAHPRDLLDHDVFHQAVGVMRAAEVPLSLVIDYVSGGNWMLATVAWVALTMRSDGATAAAEVLPKFSKISTWSTLYALKYFASLTERPPAGALLLNCPSSWADDIMIPGLLVEHFEERAAQGDGFGFGNALAQTEPEALTHLEKLLRTVRHPGAKQLLDELAEWRRATLDRKFLQPIGRFLGGDSDEQLLVEPASLADLLASAVACIEHDPPRSMLVVGEPRTGKTSFVRLLAQRISAQGWTVFEADGAALMAGQIYIGELEKQLRRLVTELAVAKKVLWYVPDFAQLATSGMYRGQGASILDQIFPALAERRIVLIGETSAAQLTKLQQLRPALRSAAEILRLPALSEAQSAQLASACTLRLEACLGVQFTAGVLDTAIHLTRQYLGNSQMPGALLDLLKLACQRVGTDGGREVRREDLVATLSQLTGMPSQVLDDRERVDLAALADFFQRRVIGQSEAVSAIVDRIAMHKAGLTDPERPIAVFLFAGPTGTGKTELAKTLAEFLFGASDRLIRVDMSEYQSEHSVHRILGDPNDNAESRALTHRVRQQPFCVVLLDEFEKAHPGVWDLFLQVFDAGRLSDTAGHTVDFRHALIILTSNLGATAHHGSGLGFTASSSVFSREQILRAVDKSFRPEFVNRLDNVIVFQPLSRELMRGILAKELSRVLQRRGLRHREWAVEWESSALDFLLDKGFSATLGARPLKRAIDQHLLAPLAATMVEHRFPEGDQFLFVRSDGRAIQVEFVDPAGSGEPADVPDLGRQPATATLAATILQARGTAAERTVLEAALLSLEEQMNGADWNALDAALSAQMRQGEFWERADRHHVLARYALLDRIKAARQTAHRLQQRLLRSIGPTGRCSAELTGRLAAQVRAVQHGIQDALQDAAIEVVVAVLPVLDATPQTALHAGWRERLLDMYRSWATQRRMQIDAVPGVAQSQQLLIISGFGAARTLLPEAGLHLLEQDSAKESSGRIVARVLVAATPTQLPRTATEKHAALLALLTQAQGPASIVRRYRLEPSPLIRDVRGRWRTGRAELVLGGQFDLLGETLPQEGLM